MRGRGHQATINVTVLVGCALFLFVDRTALPIVLWDESRNVVNALEMRTTGWSLVTTYGGTPDLWNTKPPLLIWLMRASVDLFGPSEWALRLPSTIAALVTVWLVMRHLTRATGAIAAGALAAVLLAISPAMFGEHSARTADYDALLVMFTTGYCCLGFIALHARRPALGVLMLAALAVAGAVLTKSVAGLMPGVGLVGYAIATGRWRRIATDARYSLAALVAAAPVATFLLAREAAGPGYLAAMWRNDLGGRFSDSVVGVERPWSFYLHDLAAGYFAATPALLLAPFVWAWMRPRERLVALHAAAIALAVIVSASAAATKLHHYILPALPFLAILAALTLTVAARRLRDWRASGGSPVVATALALVLALTAYNAIRGAVVLRYLAPQVGEGARSGGYGALFASVFPQAVSVIDRGFVNDAKPGYAPVLRAYQLLAEARGQIVRRSDRIEPGTITASCDAFVVLHLAAARPVVARTDGCIAVRPIR